MYYSVGTKEKELSVVVTPSKKKYLPGEEVTLGVEVKDSKGNPVAAEISLAVVDMSVLALVGNQKKTPVTFFYNGEPLTISTAINVKNVLNVAEIPLGTKGGGSGGDGLEKKKRGVFRDTAHWSGTVETDATGKATATFTLPDNLTEWQVESVGVTKDTRIGVGYSEFISRKTVMVVPLQPRFILPGDSFAIGGTIFNESDEVQKLNISVTSPTLTLTGSDKTTVTLSPHTSMSISFPATAPPSVVEGKHAFTLLAKNAAYEDVVLGSFPIVRNDTYESTATAGRITDEKWTEQLYLPKNVIADRGSLTLSLSATMATILDGAVREMFFYPYQCSEQVASKLRTIAIVTQHEQLFKNAVSVLPERITIGGEDLTLSEVVERGLAKLYQNQGPDGGMALYPNQPPSFWVTLSTLETFIDLKRAGYKVDEVKLGLSAQYVYNHINYPQTNILDGAEDTIVASYVLSRLEDKKRWESAAVRERLVGYANNKALVQNGLSARALAYLSILSDQKKFGILVTNRLFAEFENRSSIDARGTIVKESSHAPSAFFENTIVNTALALKAFSETERDTPLLLGYVRAIKKSRSQSGSWASTYNNITVISAMTAYLRFTNEASANMTISAMLDGDVLLGAEFGKTNIFGIYATTVPMHMLKKGESQAITFFKKNLGLLNNAYYYDILLKYYLPTETIPPRDEGFSVRRELYAQGDVKFENPVYTALQGEVLRGRVLLSVPKTRFNVAIEDFIPAGFEIVNQRFATEDPNLGQENIETQVSQMNNDIGQENPWWSRSLGGIFSESKKARGPNKEIDGIMSDAMYGNKNTTLRTLYPTAVENHDDRIFAFISQLDEGEYVYEYFVRALVPGTYQHLPLLVSELYTPENFGRTRGSSFTITKKVE